MAGRYWISWLIFFGVVSLLAWWFSNRSLIVGLLVFAVLTVPISLWVRAKSNKIGPTKGTQK